MLFQGEKVPGTGCSRGFLHSDALAAPVPGPSEDFSCSHQKKKKITTSLSHQWHIPKILEKTGMPEVAVKLLLSIGWDQLAPILLLEGLAQPRMMVKNNNKFNKIVILSV